MNIWIINLLLEFKDQKSQGKTKRKTHKDRKTRRGRKTRRKKNLTEISEKKKNFLI